MHKRTSFDVEAYTENTKGGPCFICEMLSGNNPHHVIYQNASTVVFLNKYPTLFGYALVAPCEHKEQVTTDFSKAEYLSIQELIYKVSDALKKVVPTERIYILSLGSQQRNRHVHWHVAPLPPGVPYEEQQFEALRTENGILEIPEEEMSQLARQIRQAMEV